MPKLPPEPPRILALVETYEELVAGLRERRISLGMSQMVADARSGLASGYVGKIEARPGFKNSRSLGMESLTLLLGAYGVKLAIVPASMPEPPRAPPMAERGRRGGKARLDRITPERRQEIARKAAATRWGRTPATMLPKPLSKSKVATEPT